MTLNIYLTGKNAMFVLILGTLSWRHLVVDFSAHFCRLFAVLFSRLSRWEPQSKMGQITTLIDFFFKPLETGSRFMISCRSVKHPGKTAITAGGTGVVFLNGMNTSEVTESASSNPRERHKVDELKRAALLNKPEILRWGEMCRK